MLKKSLVYAGLLGVAALGASSAAMAGVSIGLNLGLPAPVVVAPAPGYYAPPPPVVYAPPPPVYAPVVAGPVIGIGWYGDRYWDGHRYWGRREWYGRHPGYRRY
jgi:hypothetical protein